MRRDEDLVLDDLLRWRLRRRLICRSGHRQCVAVTVVGCCGCGCGCGVGSLGRAWWGQDAGWCAGRRRRHAWQELEPRRRAIRRARRRGAMRRGRRNRHRREGCTGRWHVVCGLPLSSDRRLGCCYFRLLLSALFRLAAEPKLFVLLGEHPCLRLLTGYPDALHALSVLLPCLLTASSLLFSRLAGGGSRHGGGLLLPSTLFGSCLLCPERICMLLLVLESAIATSVCGCAIESTLPVDIALVAARHPL